MMKTLTAALPALFLLNACGTLPEPADPVERPAPHAVDPRLCLPPREEPVQGDDASIVRPETEAERRATAAFLRFQAAVIEWGRAGWERAGIARPLCDPDGTNTD